MKTLKSGNIGRLIRRGPSMNKFLEYERWVQDISSKDLEILEKKRKEICLEQAKTSVEHKDAFNFYLQVIDEEMKRKKINSAPRPGKHF